MALIRDEFSCAAQGIGCYQSRAIFRLARPVHLPDSVRDVAAPADRLDITYAASILLTSTQPRYILANLSWLVGALATVVQDLFVIGQFAVYHHQDRKARQAALDESSSRQEERVGE